MRRFCLDGFGALGGRFAEQAVRPLAFFVGIAVATCAQRILLAGRGLAEAFAGLNLQLFKPGQFFVQIQMVEVQLRSLPLFLADGLRLGRRLDGLRRGDRNSGLLLLFSALVEQLLRSIEHLQASATAHHAAGHAQLRMVDAEAGLAMWALCYEAIAHAATRIRQACILAPTTTDAHPAIAIGDRVQIKVLRVGCCHFVALLGKDAG